MIAVFCPQCGVAEKVFKGRKLDYLCEKCDKEFDLLDAETLEVGKDEINILRAYEENRIIVLPVPIGGTIYIPYRFEDTDGTIDAGVEEARISGYVKEGNREFYTIFDECGASDIEPGKFYLTREAAEIALEALGVEGGGINNG